MVSKFLISLGIRFKLLGSDTEDQIVGVGILVEANLCMNVVIMNKTSDRLMVVAINFNKKIARIVYAYAPQRGRLMSEEKFYEKMARGCHHHHSHHPTPLTLQAVNCEAFENPSIIFHCSPKVTNNSKLQVSFGTRFKECRKSLEVGAQQQQSSSSFCVCFHASMGWKESHNGSSAHFSVLGKFRFRFHFFLNHCLLVGKMFFLVYLVMPANTC